MSTAVIQQDNDGELFIILPHDIAEELDLNPGDDLEWEVDSPAGGHVLPSVTLRKL